MKIKKHYWIIDYDGYQREVSAFEFYLHKSSYYILMFASIMFCISAIGVFIDIIKQR